MGLMPRPPGFEFIDPKNSSGDGLYEALQEGLQGSFPPLKEQEYASIGGCLILEEINENLRDSEENMRSVKQCQDTILFLGSEEFGNMTQDEKIETMMQAIKQMYSVLIRLADIQQFAIMNTGSSVDYMNYIHQQQVDLACKIAKVKKADTPIIITGGDASDKKIPEVDKEEKTKGI